MKRIAAFFLVIITYTHAKEIVLWDLHNVLVKRHNTGKVVWDNARPVLARLPWAALAEITALLMQQMYREISSEEIIKIAQKYQVPELKDFIIKVGNAQQVNPGMDKLVQELNKLGIEQHLGSNIGKKVFQRLRDSKTHPEINAMLDYLDLTKSKVVQYSPHTLIKKPNPLYFEQYLQANNLNPQKDRIFFIDDKLSNVSSAKKVGLIGIHFKNIDQLKTDLRAQGIPLKK